MSTRSNPASRKPALFLTFEEFKALPSSVRDNPGALAKQEPDAVRQKHGLSPSKPIPCPFCGQKPRFRYIPAVLAAPELDRPFYSLTCHRPSNHCPAHTAAFGDTKAEAIENWNTRAPVKSTPAQAQTAAALAACRSIRFAVKNADRYGGEFSLNDILSADRLAREALGEKGGASCCTSPPRAGRRR